MAAKPAPYSLEPAAASWLRIAPNSARADGMFENEFTASRHFHGKQANTKHTWLKPQCGYQAIPQTSTNKLKSYAKGQPTSQRDRLHTKSQEDQSMTRHIPKT